MPEETKESKKTETVDHGKKLAEWKFTEYIKYERSPGRYAGLGIIELAVMVYSIISKNLLFAVVAILFGFILVLHAKRDPAELSCQIFEDGIQIGSKFYEWDEIKKFRLVYQPPTAKWLYVDLKSVFLTDFSVPLGDQNPLDIRQILKTYLEEDLERQYETLSDRANRWFKL